MRVHRAFLTAKENWMFYVPALGVFGVFFIFPAFSAFYYGMTDWDGLSRTLNFVGFNNFKELLSDKVSLKALLNTFEYTLLFSASVNVFGVMLALIFDQKMKTAKLMKTVFFMPDVFSAVIAGYLFTYIYSPRGGLVNEVLKAAGLGMFTKTWLGDVKTVIPAIVFTSIWQYLGAHGVMYLAGLQSIPTDLYEAADIDGVTLFSRFRNITLPLLGPAITLNCVWALINYFKVFDIIFIMTNGGPVNASQSVTTMIYQFAFKNSRFGYAAALGIVLFLIIAGMSMFLASNLRKREVEM